MAKPTDTQTSTGSSSMLDELLEFAYGVAEEASRMIVDGSNARWRAVAEVDDKKNSVDLVTATDQAVEEMIKRAIRERYPGHKFIGEETYEKEKRIDLTDEYTWVVDPIDGTMNFVHSFPSVACSIGLMHNKEAILGVVALPFMSQIFSARRGGGAFMNRKVPLPLTGGIPQPLSRLQDCLIAAEWGTDRSAATFGPKTRSFARLAGSAEHGVEGGIMAHALRTTGSSACNIIAVATGQLDVYWDAGMYAWDVCAGMAILREVGGFYSGGADDFARNANDGTVLLCRRFVAVRAVPPSKEESATEIQRRLVRELYDVVEPWTNADM